jgi:GAF domain-containing protein
MSALAHRPQTAFSTRPELTETDTLFKISRVAGLEPDVREAIESIAGLALGLSGIRRIELEPADEFVRLAGIPLVWGSSFGRGVQGSAVAEVTATGHNWGQLRIHFDLPLTSTDNPLRFAIFIAQQIAGLLGRAAMAAQRERFNEQIRRIRTIVAKRKSIQRARALLSASRQVSEREALAFMCKWSRQSGQNLHHVAEALLSNDSARRARLITEAAVGNTATLPQAMGRRL